MTRKRTGGGRNRSRGRSNYPGRLAKRGLAKAPQMSPFATEPERDRLRRRQDEGAET